MVGPWGRGRGQRNARAFVSHHLRQGDILCARTYHKIRCITPWRTPRPARGPRVLLLGHRRKVGCIPGMYVHHGSILNRPLLLCSPWGAHTKQGGGHGVLLICRALLTETVILILWSDCPVASVMRCNAFFFLNIVLLCRSIKHLKGSSLHNNTDRSHWLFDLYQFREEKNDLVSRLAAFGIWWC